MKCLGIIGGIVNKMPYYHHKPTSIFAIQYTGDNEDEIAEKFKLEEMRKVPNKRLYIMDAECSHLAPGDYAFSVRNTLKFYPKEYFEERYEISDAPMKK